MYLVPNEEYEQLLADQKQLREFLENAAKDEDEEDFLIGKTCNPDAPEECESCQ